MYISDKALVPVPQPIMLAHKSSLLCLELCFQNQNYAQELTVLEYLNLISAKCK